MGVVYEVYDPALARKVAVKVVQPCLRDANDHARAAAARNLLIREARNLARLAHPNVVPIYDVGLVDNDAVFMAIEYISGNTLRQLLNAKKLSWRRGLEIVLEAAQGLAAAHAAGLVHLDFKPENIMVARDGRVLVLDFGLSNDFDRQDGEQARDLRMLRDQSHRSLEASMANTPIRRGAGTPEYMSPEQMAGARGHPRADLFALGVVLFEVMVGKRPFPARAWDKLRAIESGELHWPRAIPHCLRELIEPTLAFDAEARGPAVEELIQLIRRRLRQRDRRWRASWGLAAALTLACAGGVVAFITDATPEPDCTRPAQEMAQVWNARVRDEVGSAFRASQLTAAPETWNRVAQALDSWSGQWLEQAQRFCPNSEQFDAKIASATVLREQSRTCLAESLAEVETLLHIWRTPTTNQILDAIASTASLSPPSACTDVKALASRSPLPSDPVLRGEVQRLLSEFGRARVLIDQNDFGAAETQLAKIYDAVVASDDVYVMAHYARERADLFYSRAEAQRSVFLPNVAALLLSVAARRDIQVSGIGASLWFLRVYHEDAREEAEHWLRSSEAYYIRSGRPLAALSSLAVIRALGLVLEGEHPRAIAVLEEVITTIRAEFDPDALELWNLTTNLGWIYDSAGDPVTSVKIQRQASQILRAKLGNDHPKVLASDGYLAGMERQVGDLERARSVIFAAIETCERAGYSGEVCMGLKRVATYVTLSTGQFRAATEIGESIGRSEREYGHRSDADYAWQETFGAEIIANRGETKAALESALRGLSLVEEDPTIHARVREQAEIAAIRTALDNGDRRLAAQLQVRFDTRSRPENSRWEAVDAMAPLERFRLACANGEVNRAILGMENALDAADQTRSSPQARAQMDLEFAKALAAGNEIALAEQVAHRGLTLQQGIHGLARHLDYEFFIVLAEMALAQGHFDEAMANLHAAHLAFDPLEVLDNRLAPIFFIEARITSQLDPSAAGQSTARELAEKALREYADWDDESAAPNVEVIKKWLVRGAQMCVATKCSPRLARHGSALPAPRRRTTRLER
jgi:tRNA A-37 threonylcarbamoyl transferase component Bud32